MMRCPANALTIVFAFSISALGCNKADEAKRPAPAPTVAAKPSSSGLLKAGGVAPEFSTTTHAGEPLSLKDLRGKVVVLYFYPKDNTPGCTTEARGFRDAYQSYRERDVVVIGVSSQDNESHRQFAEEHGLPFVLIPDEEGEIAKSYGVGSFLGLANRVTFIIDQEGTIAKVYEKVAPQNHAEEVLADIDALIEK